MSSKWMHACLAWVAAFAINATAQSLQVPIIQEAAVLEGPRTVAARGFGQSVKFGNGTLAVASPGELFDGKYNGSVRVYDSDSLALVSTLIPRVTLSDYDNYMGFGRSMEHLGDDLFVGAPQRDNHLYLAEDAGAVYPYTQSISEQSPIYAPQATIASSANLGISLGASSSLLAIGCYREEVGGRRYAGAVYIYDPGHPPLQLNRVLPNDSVPTGSFGVSVAISDSHLAVGSRSTDDIGTDTGSAYLFDVPGLTQIAKISPPLAGEYQYFGSKVLLHGDKVFVGAGGSTIATSGAGTHGKVYAFDVNNGQLLYYVGSTDNGQYSDGFGSFGLAVAGEFLLVAAYAADDFGDGSGVVHVYKLENGQLVARLGSALLDANDQFGYSVDATGMTVAVGAPSRPNDLPDEPGRVYLYDMTLAVDADEDGLILQEELDAGTDPESPDTDSDGLSDGEELKVWSTNPLEADTDGGGVNDGIEIADGTDPLDPLDDAVCVADLSGDGVLDNGDIGVFITLFLAVDVNADFTGDGIIDNGDIGAFLIAFLAGC